MARLIWTNKALEHFEGLLAYIAADSPLAARRFGEKMLAKVELLETYPNLGGWIAEDDTRTYREVLQGNYRVIYRTDGDAVYLVAVHHAARLLDVTELN